MFTEQSAHISSGKVVIDLKEYFQAAVADEGFPSFVVRDLELREVLRDEQKLHAKAGGLRDRMLDCLHASEAGEFVEHEQGRIAGPGTALDPLHLADRHAD